MSDEAMEIESESRLRLALADHPENSFLISLKISHTEELDRLEGSKHAHRAQGPEFRPASPKTTHIHFPFLRRVFEAPSKAAVFQDTFRRYVIQDVGATGRYPWKIGFTFSVSLRRLIAVFVRTANKMKVKVSVADAARFRFRCVLLDSLGGPSDLTFSVQIYDFIGEYVFDIRNETIPQLPFLLMCRTFYKKAKKIGINKV